MITYIWEKEHLTLNEPFHFYMVMHHKYLVTLTSSNDFPLLEGPYVAKPSKLEGNTEEGVVPLLLSSPTLQMCTPLIMVVVDKPGFTG